MALINAWSLNYKLLTEPWSNGGVAPFGNSLVAFRRSRAQITLGMVLLLQKKMRRMCEIYIIHMQRKNAHPGQK